MLPATQQMAQVPKGYLPEIMIHKLPESVYSKIAAGEVVDRPASAIRELAENSLDAGSLQISIIINSETGFEVLDNGCGMGQEDLSICAQKHTTSKIEIFDDIYRLSSLGFRGEALYSIAAVSEIEIRSADNDNGSGWLLKIKFGKVCCLEPVSHPRGTRIKIERLFANVPAREKFLKSGRSEFYQIKETFIRLALANPGRSMELKRGSKTEMIFPGHFSLRDTAAAVFSAEMEKHLLEISADNTPLDLHGYICSRGLPEASRRHQYFVLAGRAVENRTLSAALNRACRDLLPADQKPVCVLFLSVPPGFYDINVHPSKKEVRFSDEDAVFSMIFRKVRRVFYRQEIQAPAESEGQKNCVMEFRGTSNESAQADPVLFPGFFQDQKRAVGFRIIGQYGRGYIVFEKDGQLLIADQHALHERINYERLLKKSRNYISVDLMIPLLFVRERSEIELIIERKNLLNRSGVEMQPFGEDTISILKIPSFIPEKKETSVLAELLDLLCRKHAPEPEEFFNDLIKRSACALSVKSGDILNIYEMDEIINSYYEEKIPAVCPHGRPYLRSFNRNEMDKFFYRP